MFRLREDDEEGDAAPGNPGNAFDLADDDDALGHEAEASVDDVYTAICPYCFQDNEMFVDLGGGEHQSYVEDCQVCCRPWQVRVDVDEEGAVTLHLEPLDE